MTKKAKDTAPIRGLVTPKHGYDHTKHANTVFTQPSKTIVGESYTIQELLRKHTTGLMPQIAKEPIWIDDATFDSLDMQKINRADIQVKKELAKEVQKGIKQTLDEIEDKRAEKFKQKEEDLKAKKRSEAKEQKPEIPLTEKELKQT